MVYVFSVGLESAGDFELLNFGLYGSWVGTFASLEKWILRNVSLPCRLPLLKSFGRKLQLLELIDQQPSL